MKKLVVYLFLLYIVIGIGFLSGANVKNPSGEKYHNYQAEDQKLANGAVIKKDRRAAYDKFVAIEDSGSVEWDIVVPEDGIYKLLFRYRSPGMDNAQIISINGKEQGIGFLISEIWTDKKRTTCLNRGHNTIKIMKDRSYFWGAIGFDYLHVSDLPVEQLPIISPVNAAFYRQQPSDITINLNCKGHSLQTITCGDINVAFTQTVYPYREDSKNISLSAQSLRYFDLGNIDFSLNFDDGYTIDLSVNIYDERKPAPLTIISFDVEHGSAVLIFLPTGKKLLIDSGKEEYARKHVIPFFERHDIEKIDYFIVTHYHDDHIGAMDEIIEKYEVDEFHDYKSYTTGDEFDFEGTEMKILNSYDDAESENDRSLSFRIEFNGFVYVHGADIYDSGQKRIWKNYPNDIRAHVYYANHHFHGSIDTNYLIKTNPYLVLVSAQEAVYARGAYTQVYKELVEKHLKTNNGRLIEDLLSLEVGHTVVRVVDGDDWSYETYKDVENCIVPYLYPQGNK